VSGELAGQRAHRERQPAHIQWVVFGERGGSPWPAGPRSQRWAWVVNLIASFPSSALEARIPAARRVRLETRSIACKRPGVRVPLAPQFDICPGQGIFRSSGSGHSRPHAVCVPLVPLPRLLDCFRWSQPCTEGRRAACAGGKRAPAGAGVRAGQVAAGRAGYQTGYQRCPGRWPPTRAFPEIPLPCPHQADNDCL
jgi:hypothetical protein